MSMDISIVIEESVCEIYKTAMKEREVSIPQVSVL